MLVSCDCGRSDGVAITRCIGNLASREMQKQTCVLGGSQVPRVPRAVWALHVAERVWSTQRPHLSYDVVHRCKLSRSSGLSWSDGSVCPWLQEARASVRALRAALSCPHTEIQWPCGVLTGHFDYS